jgi:hypothetical protein
MLAVAYLISVLAASDIALLMAATDIGWETPITAAGIVILGLTGFIWFRPGVDAVIKAKDDRIAELTEHLVLVRAQRDKLLESQTTQVLPAVLQSNSLFERIIPLIEKGVR